MIIPAFRGGMVCDGAAGDRSRGGLADGDPLLGMCDVADCVGRRVGYFRDVAVLAVREALEADEPIAWWVVL